MVALKLRTDGSTGAGILKTINRYVNKDMTILMIICLFFPLLNSCINVVNIDRVNLILLVIGLAICLSNKSKKLRSNFLTESCRKCSFSLYLVHLNIADLINWFCKTKYKLGVWEQYIIYIIGTILGMLLLLLINRIIRLLVVSIRKG